MDKTQHDAIIAYLNASAKWIETHPQDSNYSGEDDVKNQFRDWYTMVEYAQSHDPLPQDPKNAGKSPEDIAKAKPDTKNDFVVWYKNASPEAIATMETIFNENAGENLATIHDNLKQFTQAFPEVPASLIANANAAKNAADAAATPTPADTHQPGDNTSPLEVELTPHAGESEFVAQKRVGDKVKATEKHYPAIAQIVTQLRKNKVSHEDAQAVENYLGLALADNAFTTATELGVVRKALAKVGGSIDVKDGALAIQIPNMAKTITPTNGIQ